MLLPRPLKSGDRIAILSPATSVKEEYVKGACSLLTRKGFDPVVMKSALGPACGSFASDLESRVSDLSEALADPATRAILCARGGYGCVQLLESVPAEDIRHDPKWLIGFSDISALHALWNKAGVVSLHAPMAKHLTVEPFDDICTSSMLSIICGEKGMDYSVAPSPLNRCGCASGELRGGNLAVLNGLASTPFDLLNVREDEDVILFVEDISEAIYAVERMFYRLYLSGTLSRIKGLIVGRFTEYRSDRNYTEMEEMIDSFLTRCGIEDIPVAFNFPVGHVSMNYPMMVGGMARLIVSPESVTLKSI